MVTGVWLSALNRWSWGGSRVAEHAVGVAAGASAGIAATAASAPAHQASREIRMTEGARDGLPDTSRAPSRSGREAPGLRPPELAAPKGGLAPGGEALAPPPGRARPKDGRHPAADHPHGDRD